MNNSNRTFKGTVHSGPIQSLAYYQDQLKTFWFGVKRPKMYEYDLIHGFNCICCSKILQDSNNGGRPKSRSGRKPGGHNRK